MMLITKWLRAIAAMLGFRSQELGPAPDEVAPPSSDHQGSEGSQDGEDEVPMTICFLDDPVTNLKIDFRGGDWARFKAAFENAAHKIPVEDRQMLRRFWARRQGDPAIIVENERILREQQIQGSAVAIGVRTDSGRKFRFAGLAIDEMTDIQVETLIAHEVAHVVQDRLVTLGKLQGEEKEAYEAVKIDCDDLVGDQA